MNLKPTARVMLEKYGNLPIKNIQVGRSPLSKAIKLMASIFGKKKKLRALHDQLFHLYLIVTLRDERRIRVEKNQDINIQPFISSKYDDIFYLKFPGKGNLNQLLETTVQKVGSDQFYDYTATNNNCQKFVMDVLTSNGYGISAHTKAFILQDVKDLLPTWSKRLAYGITSMANRSDLLFHGAS